MSNYQRVAEEKLLDLLLQWLLMPNSLVQQALAVRAPLCCWADFRGTGLGDAKLEKLLKCLGSMELKLERLYLAANNITHRLGHLVGLGRLGAEDEGSVYW